MKIDPNAPAKPSVEYNHDGTIYNQNFGLTIRAEIAARIMADNSLYCYDAERAAEIAVHRADALIAELNKGETP